MVGPINRAPKTFQRDMDSYADGMRLLWVCLESPYLRIAEYYFGGLPIIPGKQPDSPNAIGSIHGIVHILPIDIQVNMVLTCYDSQYVELVEACLDSCTVLSAGESTNRIARIGGDKLIMSIWFHFEAVHLRTTCVCSKDQPTRTPFDDSHLHLKSKIAEVSSMSKAEREIGCALYNSMIRNSGEFAVVVCVPVVCILTSQRIVEYGKSTDCLLVDTLHTLRCATNRRDTSL